jgi:hypothetical protein
MNTYIMHTLAFFRTDCSSYLTISCLYSIDKISNHRETRSRILCRVAENQGLDLVERSTPSKTKKKNAQTGGAGNVDAPAPTTTGANQDERTEGGSSGNGWRVVTATRRKKMRGNTEPRKKKTLQAQASASEEKER